MQKKKPLKEIIAISPAHPDAGEEIIEPSRICEAVAEKYKVTWGSGDPELWVRQLNFCLDRDHIALNFDHEEITIAFRRVARRSLKDVHGVAVEALRCIFEANSSFFALVLEAYMTSTVEVQNTKIVGKVQGKMTSKPHLGQVRAIMPLPALHALADVLLANRLRQFCETHFPPNPSIHIGAVPNTQVMDIAHATQTVIEKGLDRFSKAAVSQSDIAAYYDNLPVFNIAASLHAAGAAPALTGALLRHQMLPQVVLETAGHQEPVPRRTHGSLTGSRVAGALGRWPVELAAREVVNDRTVHGFTMTSGPPLMIATYVDNLYGFGDTAFQAVHILKRMEHLLKSRWDLKIKQGSEEVLVCRGAPELSGSETEPPSVVHGFAIRDSMVVLGHLISSDAAPDACFRRTELSVVARFWGSAAARPLRRWCLERRLQILRRCVTPVWLFRAARWAATAELARWIDRLQRRLFVKLIRYVPMPGENIAAFVRRRGRAVAHIQREAGPWSTMYLRRVISWHEHVLRRPAMHWMRRLLQEQPDSWLQNRRLSRGTPAHAGRTGTRLRGPVRVRWQTSVTWAREELARRPVPRARL